MALTSAAGGRRLLIRAEQLLGLGKQRLGSCGVARLHLRDAGVHHQRGAHQRIHLLGDAAFERLGHLREQLLGLPDILGPFRPHEVGRGEIGLRQHHIGVQDNRLPQIADGVEPQLHDIRREAATLLFQGIGPAIEPADHNLADVQFAQVIWLKRVAVHHELRVTQVGPRLVTLGALLRHLLEALLRQLVLLAHQEIHAVLERADRMPQLALPVVDHRHPVGPTGVRVVHALERVVVALVAHPEDAGNQPLVGEVGREPQLHAQHVGGRFLVARDHVGDQRRGRRHVVHVMQQNVRGFVPEHGGQPVGIALDDLIQITLVEHDDRLRDRAIVVLLDGVLVDGRVARFDDRRRRGPVAWRRRGAEIIGADGLLRGHRREVADFNPCDVALVLNLGRLAGFHVVDRRERIHLVLVGNRHQRRPRPALDGLGPGENPPRHVGDDLLILVARRCGVRSVDLGRQQQGSAGDHGKGTRDTHGWNSEYLRCAASPPATVRGLWLGNGFDCRQPAQPPVADSPSVRDAGGWAPRETAAARLGVALAGRAMPARGARRGSASARTGGGPSAGRGADRVARRLGHGGAASVGVLRRAHAGPGIGSSIAGNSRALPLAEGNGSRSRAGGASAARGVGGGRRAGGR